MNKHTFIFYIKKNFDCIISYDEEKIIIFYKSLNYIFRTPITSNHIMFDGVENNPYITFNLNAPSINEVQIVDFFILCLDKMNKIPKVSKNV